MFVQSLLSKVIEHYIMLILIQINQYFSLWEIKNQPLHEDHPPNVKILIRSFQIDIN